MSEFSYRLTVLDTPDEDDGPVDPEAVPQGGHAFLTLPFDADPETLLSVALEQVGIFSSHGFDIESDDTGGFLVRDLEGEAMLALELEVEDESEPGDDLYYAAYGAYDGDEELEAA